MTISNEMINELRRVLGPIIRPSILSANAAWDIFEAYNFLLVLEAARVEGASITFLDVTGDRPSEFIFRTGPGEIWSQRHKYCHAIIGFNHCPELEAHLGVYVVGKSGVRHELDVCVLYSQEAQTCRIARSTPRSSEVIIGIECKFYSSQGIGLGLGRSFLGLCQDNTSKDCFFVSNIDSGSIGKLLAHHNKKWDHGIVPAAHNNVTVLKAKYQTTFKNYLAKHRQ